MNWFIPYSEQTIQPWLSRREGETRLGNCLRFLPQQDSLDIELAQLKQQGVQFALIGINEDLGPRANLGQGGAGDGFQATIAQWINLQSNTFLNGSECVLLGEIHTNDLLSASDDTLQVLRQQVAIIDERVESLIKLVVAAGMEPIVIGGGHNNAYGLLKACSQTFKQPMAAVNLDPHSDFRLLEGRHSGNGFSYAAHEGWLGFYHVLGLHELKNSDANLAQLEAFGGSWHSLQQIWVRQELSLSQVLYDICQRVNTRQLPLALELDVDAIAQFPSSAMTAAGIPLLDAAHYVYTLAKNCDCRYLHLAEAAGSCHPQSPESGRKQIGQSLCELIYAYIQGRLSR